MTNGERIDLAGLESGTVSKRRIYAPARGGRLSGLFGGGVDTKLASTVARRLYAYYRDRESPAPPAAVAWEISFACDAKCPFCATHDLHREHGSPSRDEALTIARNLGRAGVHTVGLSGGEPLLYKHLREVLVELRRHGVRITLTTNGSRLEHWAADLVQLGIGAITVSVDAAQGSEHEAIRRVNGLFERIEAGIGAIRAQPGGEDVHIGLRSVIDPRQPEEMAAMVSRWKGRVDDVSFQPLQDLGEGHVHRAGNGEREQADRSAFEEAIADLIARHPEYDVDYYRRMPEYVFDPDGLRNSFHCVVPSLSFKVQPKGQVIPCSDSSVILGDLRTEPLERAWQHPYMKQLRHRSRHRCRTCLCWVQPISVNDRVPSSLSRLIPPARPSESA